MPHVGFVDPVMNDGPRFRSNMPVSELTKRITRATEASSVSSAPPVMKTMDGVTGLSGSRHSDSLIPWLA